VTEIPPTDPVLDDQEPAWTHVITRSCQHGAALISRNVMKNINEQNHVEHALGFDVFDPLRAELRTLRVALEELPRRSDDVKAEVPSVRELGADACREAAISCSHL
jgi:hypothetical protein